ncbi:MAG: HD domain-containing protein [Bacilli bacterium]|nr:HD domain-containing protein [Bacilli bacterium]
MKRPELEHKMEQYIKYLINVFYERCINEKPVIMHSVRVSMNLYDLGYDEKIVLNALLHDVVEDSDISLKELEEKFGLETALLVASLTENKNIKDKIKRNEELIDRSASYGFRSLIIKCADILDNSKYHYLVTDKEVSDRLFKKYDYFLKRAVLIKDEKIYKQLEEQVSILKEKMEVK